MPMMRTLIGEPNARVDVAGTSMLVAVMLIHLTGPSVFVLQPIVVQGLVEQMGFSAQQANFTMFVEGGGKAIASVALIWLVSKVSWRRLLLVALLTMVAGNIASIFVRQNETFLVLRSLTGAAAGIIVPLSYATVGLTPKADRNFGLMWVVLFIYAGFAFLISPTIYRLAGMNGMFGFFASLAACGLLLLRYMPVAGSLAGESNATTIEVPWPRSILAIAGMFLFSAGMFAFWANAALIAKEANITEQDIAYALSLSQFVSIAGALTTTFLALRFGRLLPLTFGFVALGASMALLLGQPGTLLFIVAIASFNYAWNMTDPYMLGAMASLGRGGRVVVYATAMRMVGVSVGPGLAAFVLSRGNLDHVIVMSVAFLACCFAVVLPALFAQRRRKSMAGAPQSGC